MPLRVTFRQLEYFVAAGEAGSIAGASQRINVSSPSISAAISDLEREFDIQLFVRHHAQGLSLTPGGRRFLGHAKALLEQAGGLADLARDISEQVRGPLAVGCMSTVAPSLWPELRRSFEHRHEGARIVQRIGHHGTLLEALRRAEIELAITYDLDLARDIAFAPLASLPPFALLPGAHPVPEGGRIGLERLAEMPMVLLDLPMSRDYFMALFQSAGLRPRIAERVADMDIVRSMVANGFGYSLANMPLLTGLSPDGKALKGVPLAGSFRPMTLGIATMAEMRATRLVEAFKAHARDWVGAGRVPGLWRVAPPVAAGR